MEYASVCNAALPFDRCAAHVGDTGWPRGARGLQVRVYDLADPVDVLSRDIEARAIADVERFSGHAPEVVCDGRGPCRKVVLSYGRFYYDYGGIAHVDFRLRRFGGRTFDERQLYFPADDN